MPMQQLLVRWHSLPGADDAGDAGDAHPCAAAAIDFMGEPVGGSSSDSNAALPCGHGVLVGNVWRFGREGIMVATAVQDAAWESASARACVTVVQLADLESLSLNIQRKAPE